MQNLHDFWKARNVDLFRQAVSLPGVSVLHLFGTLTDRTQRNDESDDEFDARTTAMCLLFSNTQAELYHLMRRHVVGGLSIVFHRFHQNEVRDGRTTRIGEQEMRAEGREPKPVKTI